ncbi:MAG: metalloregulator ArsR/SmtB family transcription factor [Moritella sp.]|uniref:metalloregulator ArsR/SmtB family transcription factor n=1 Tax=Moritella sp. TaxID=78556 RepID=UPI00299F943F|nr:metalloregulator ArsR/SmtB family transcription factor [Moritella sp.]MDX2322022.1 metalloregulator ArsR/SmtB family transcription factor [Moritella sp.]
MDLIQFYKCLADDTRLKSILLIQQESELCVCELTHALDQSQPKISRHLALLRQHKLVVIRRQGQWIYYQINPQLPDWAQQILSLSLANNAESIKEEVTRLAEMSCRPDSDSSCK